MKKYLIILLIIAFTASMLAIGVGCKSEAAEEETGEEIAAEKEVAEEEAGEEAVEEEQITLRFPHWFFGHGGTFEEWINGGVDAFEAENPNVTVEREQVPYDVYWEKLEVAVAGGNPPDIAAFAPGNLGKFIAGGALLPLDDMIDIDDVMANFGSLQTESIPAAAPDGKTYALGFDSGFYLPMYRPSVFQEAGIEEYAKTPDEFVEMVKKLTSGDRYGYAFMVQPGNYTEALYDYDIWVIGLGGHWGDDAGMPTLDSPEVIEAMTYLKEIVDAGAIPLDTDKGTYREMFGTGAVGTLIDGMWMYGLSVEWDPTAADDFMTAPLPFPTQRVAGFYEAHGVLAGGEHPEVAAKLVEYLSNPEQSIRLVQLTQLIPPRTAVFTDELKAELIEANPWYKEYIDHADNAVLVVPPAMDPDRVDEVIKIWNANMERVFFEDADVTEAMQEAQQQAMALFE